MNMKRILAFFLAAALLASLAGCDLPPSETNPTEGPKMDTSGKYLLNEERNEAIITVSDYSGGPVIGNANLFYHIFVGSFSDSNGDGIGDLRGIINRMDYLNDGDPNSGVSLGIEGIWLSPIFMSPSYHKYDATDYYQIDPKFGTMEDLQELVDLCHSRGVKIILDLVINHTSTANMWFQNFANAHQNNLPNNVFYDFYTHSPDTTSTGTWYTIPGCSNKYEGNFSGDMPELNFDNEMVREEMVNLARFYLEMGIDGFRFDAAKYIYYGDEPRNADFWIWYMQELRAIKPDIYTVAEVWDSDSATYPYFASTNCFNFSMSQVGGRIDATAKNGNVNTFTRYVDQYLKEIKSQREDAMMVTFISNHDMDRAAGYLQVATNHAKMAANLSILLPGSTFVYYGEEIGMLGSRGGANTDANRRLAMQWGDQDTVKNPVGSTYSNAAGNGTVADHLPDGNSLYNHYKELIAIRKANPAIAYGEFEPLNCRGKAGGFLSTWNGQTVMVLHNTTNAPVEIVLSEITDIPFINFAAIVGVGEATLNNGVLTIDPQTSVVMNY